MSSRTPIQNNNKKRIEDNYEPCKNNESGITYYRNTTKEKELIKYVSMGTQIIHKMVQPYRNQFPSPSKDSIYYEINDSEFVQDYQPFLWLTTKQIVEQSKTTQFMTDSFGWRDVNPEKLFSNTENRHSPRIINIIAYKKNLNYLLKYMAFHLHNSIQHLDGEISWCFMVFCDEDSFQFYNEHANDLEMGWETSTIPRLFSEYLKSSMKLTKNDLDVLEKVSIFFVHSTHALMKGIGGKRAAIQYYHCHYLSNQSPDYTCLTIDDNITGIVKISPVECNFRTAQQTTLNDTCEMANLLDVYLKLEHVTHGNILFSGIYKGKGQGDNNHTKKPLETMVKETDTSTIYKLNMSRPIELYNRQYFYNPFFGLFFEDVIFNNCLGLDKNCKKLDFHLRFGHESKGDNEDVFPIIKTDESAFQPFNGGMLMYVLLVHYLYPHENNRFLYIHIESRKTKSTTTADLSIPTFFFYDLMNNPFQPTSKYRSKQQLFYVLSLLYASAKNHPNVVLCSQTDQKIQLNNFILQSFETLVKLGLVQIDKTSEDETKEYYSINVNDNHMEKLHQECGQLTNLYRGNVSTVALISNYSAKPRASYNATKKMLGKRRRFHEPSTHSTRKYTKKTSAKIMKKPSIRTPVSKRRRFL